MNNILRLYDEGITWLVRLLPRGSAWLQRWQQTPRLSLREQIIFYKRLGMMLQADMTITKALHLMIAETKKRAVESFIRNVVQAVSAGSPLSAALCPYKSCVGQYSLHIIAIGEASGTLATNLEYVATELKKKQELRKHIIGALIYPLIVCAATIGITVFLLVYIFPKILPIFASLHTELPLSTRILITLSQWLVQYGWWLLLGSVIVVVVFSLLQRVASVRYLTASVVLRLPIFGRLSQYYNVATISRTVGLLLQNEIRITQALDIAASSTENMLYQAALTAARDDVVTGKTVASGYRKYPHLWPVLVVQMVEAGEATGNLATTCSYLSDMYESDIRDWTKTMTVLLEPLLMLFMGLCVGFIAISIITPIYGITAQLHS